MGMRSILAVVVLLGVRTAGAVDVTECGQVIPPGTKNIVHLGTGDSTYTFKGLAPGAHEVIAVLGYGDHSAMPQQRDTVKFIVKK